MNNKQHYAVSELKQLHIRLIECTKHFYDLCEPELAADIKRHADDLGLTADAAAKLFDLSHE